MVIAAHLVPFWLNLAVAAVMLASVAGAGARGSRCHRHSVQRTQECDLLDAVRMLPAGGAVKA